MQRKRGVEGLLPPERKPNRAQLLGLGLGLGLPGCLSDMVDAGSRVQKALLQPVPMFTTSERGIEPILLCFVCWKRITEKQVLFVLIDHRERARGDKNEMQGSFIYIEKRKRCLQLNALREI